MQTFIPETKRWSQTINSIHSPDKIWPLLCPVREYDWIEHWRCDLIHSQSGVNEFGCVFRTNFPTDPGGPEIWVTSRFDAPQRLEFVRTGVHRVVQYRIELKPTGNGTQMVWSHHVIALDETGNKIVAQSDPQVFSQMILSLGKMLDYYLSHGEMYREKSNHADDR